MPYLLSLDDPKGMKFPISNSPYDILKIGRGTENALVLEEKTISEFHAQIRTANSRYWIEDLQSEWGTSVNGARISTKLLKDLDTIHIGSGTRFQFVMTDTDKASSGIKLKEPLPIKASLTSPQDLIHPSNETLASTASSILSQIDDTGQVLMKYELDVPRLTIGRAPDNAIQLDHRTVSRKHCEIALSNNVFIVTDLGSSNGTKINGNRITHDRLVQGSVLSIGNLQFKFEQSAPANDTSPPVKLTEPRPSQASSGGESKTMRVTVGGKKDGPLVWISILIALSVITVLVMIWSFSGG